MAEILSSAVLPAIQKEEKDYFIEKDGVIFAGCHVLADLWGACNLTDRQADGLTHQRHADTLKGGIIQCLPCLPL